MNCVELFPALSHCIEDTAKEEFWNLASKYIEVGQGDRGLEEQIELLKAFLESTDFRKLRRESESHLTQGKVVKFTIYWEADKAGYDMVVI